MVNALIQTENVNSYNFMENKLETGAGLMHTLWFDVKNDSVKVFSRFVSTFVGFQRYREFLANNSRSRASLKIILQD